MNVVFTLYEGMTPLDLVGPFQIFAIAPDMQVTLAASTAGPIKTDTGMVIVADKSLHEIEHADIIVVPGTSRPDLPMGDRILVEWLARTCPRARWTCSVCTGSMVLGAAGLLRGKRATTHWMAIDALRQFGAEPVRERVVTDGQLVTAAGVSAGIDMALTLMATLTSKTTAQAIQLGIEYDPQPPFSAGSPASAGAEIVDIATRMMMEANVTLAVGRTPA